MKSLKMFMVWIAGWECIVSRRGLGFSRGEADGIVPRRSITILFPVVYHDEVYDGFAGHDDVYAMEASTVLCFRRDKGIGFWEIQAQLLGFGISITYQLGY